MTGKYFQYYHLFVIIYHEYNATKNIPEILCSISAIKYQIYCMSFKVNNSGCIAAKDH